MTPVTEPPITLMRLADGRLELRRGEATHVVTARRCFPWSEPGHYVSLRDADDNEVALVASPTVLDAASREALECVLAEAGFVLVITGIASITEEFELRLWKVQTSQGPRQFQTARDEWPREVPGGGLLIRDVAGDLYHIPAPEQLDAASQKRLWAFVD